MNRFAKPKLVRALVCATSLLIQSHSFRAQDGPPPGNFNPAEMRQRELDRIREALELKDDSEWKTISERVTKILDLNRSLRGFGGPQGFGGPGGRNRPAPPDGDGGPGPGGPPPGGEPPDRPPDSGGRPPNSSPEAEALRDAVKNKASKAEIKDKMAKLVEARKKQQADLTAAKEQLRQLLSVRQEAVAITLGLL